MIIKHFFVEKIAHSSYILASEQFGAVIDPKRDVDTYINEARKMGIEITHILQTHLHADFVSGHMELAAKTGADIYMPASANVEFKHVPLREGDTFTIEDIQVAVLETPGHTPEHISYVVSDLARASEPSCVFTGDTLFVGDVGRPDLFPGRKEELANQLYHSLQKLMQLSDYCEVYPAHGAGSLCGKAMGAKYTSTIGYERKFNSILQIKDLDDFVHQLTEDMPGVPDHFGRCSEINRMGPASTEEFPTLRLMDPETFKSHYQQDDTIVLDVRRYEAFGGLHIPNSYSLDMMGNFPIFAGWVLPQDKKILICATDLLEAREAVLWLRRVGLDNSIGYLMGGLKEWAAKGYLTDRVIQLHSKELLQLNKDYQLVDSRTAATYQEHHIDGAINIPAPEFRSRHTELDRHQDIVVICNSGVRSSLAISILKQRGFFNLYNIAGGMLGYNAYHGN